MRVLVCGGRDFIDEKWLKDELCDLVWQRGRFTAVKAQPTVIIHCQHGATENIPMDIRQRLSMILLLNDS